jgi:uncharacterized membrane protein YoaK (UPF0700 family)
LGYVVGAGAGELILLRQNDAPPAPGAWPSQVYGALAAELVCLIDLLASWHLAGPPLLGGTVVPVVALAAVAMGIQSAVVLGLHVGPTTTYVTGTLTTFTTEAVQWLRLIPAPGGRSASRQDLRTPRLTPGDYGWTWITYLLGALARGLLYPRIGELALILPILAIAAAVAEVRDRPQS